MSLTRSGSSRVTVWPPRQHHQSSCSAMAAHAPSAEWSASCLRNSSYPRGSLNWYARVFGRPVPAAPAGQLLHVGVLAPICRLADVASAVLSPFEACTRSNPFSEAGRRAKLTSTEVVRKSAALRASRLRSGLSQEALAERAGMGTAAVASLERGRRRSPYPSALGALAEALGLSADERRRVCRLRSRTR
jgi:hypothetical protein